ncbi:NAD(+) diphosphatase [Frigoribacterium sp. CG_9.8]|uniref:NAD(+) diphosphatase n=1 Tax=Frigoribacterium sp. CG_9.8 TaxID=2787733 RepID=UPI001A2F20DD|nr:NAD(+) diphosphatase [Frigoribacterium sp. CG_9.8]MBG6107513.1 NAD+ diphosphatase [Frigoribacterium sp. CG_9.8]
MPTDAASQKPAIHPDASPDYLMPLPISALPLSRHGLDRDYLSRSDPDLFETLRHDPRMRQLVLWKGKALLASGGTLDLLANDAELNPELRLYLGRTVGSDSPGDPVIAVIVSDDTARSLAPADSDRWGDLRALGNTFSDRDAGLFTAALALANWHDSHRFSPRTGMATVANQGGWVRTDTENGREVFPRTDPAIIVGIVDAEDRLLLGHNAMWPADRFSLLAGFVEPGESLESAVLREVFEESGIRVVDPVYLGSQPWPFPASLMLGFMARVDPRITSILTPDGAEILELRWFSREELTAALDDIGLPGHTSIARAIIEHWYGGPIADRRQW